MVVEEDFGLRIIDAKCSNSRMRPGLAQAGNSGGEGGVLSPYQCRLNFVEASCHLASAHPQNHSRHPAEEDDDSDYGSAH